MIVPYATGGAPDALARLLSRRLSETLGQQFVVENRPGAGGIAAAELSARAPADGYTVFFSDIQQLAINPQLFTKLPYDPIKDFAPVSLVVSFPTVITVNKSLRVDSLSDLLKIARSGRVVTAAHSGNGGLAHLALALLNNMAKTDLVLVPYNGDAPVMNALLGGHVDMAVTTLFAAKPHIDSGRIKVLASTGASRAGALPQVPTVAEAANLPGYQGNNFIGLVVPAGTPADIVRKINEHLVVYLRTEEFKSLFPTDDVIASTPSELEVYLREANERNARLIKATGIKDSN
jgi:tripartite-type tricarboxylate transporter receptor subunit TctC